MRSPIRLSFVAAAAAIGSSALAGVIVVDSSGGGAFTEINPAVTAAAEGDVILVKSGSYAGFMIDNKGVAVVADAGAGVNVLGSIQIGALAAGKVVVLDRLNVMTPYPLAEVMGHGLRALNCAGRIRVQGCTITGSNGNPNGLGPSCNAQGFTHGFDGARVDHCSDVAFSLCILKGGAASDLFEFPDCDGTPLQGDPGGAGMRAVSSIVSLYDSQCFGGTGGEAWYFGGDGGAGVHLETASLVTSNTQCHGGNGEDAWDFIGNPDPGAGASGLFLGTGSVARALDCTFASGTGGQGLFEPGFVPLPVTGPGTFLGLPGDSKGFGMPKVLRELQNSFMTLAGNPGDTAFLLVSAGTGNTFAPAFKGILHLSGAGLLGPYLVGVIPAGGQLQVPVAAPPLPAGLLELEIYLQGILADGTGGTLTAYSHLTLLDSSL